MDRRAWTLLVSLGAIWGGSYLLIKIGLRDLSPGMVAFLRVVLAAGVLVALASARNALGGFGHLAGWILLIALAQVSAPFVLIAAGEQHITSSLAGILVASAPIFTALLAIRVDQDERAEGMRLVGVLLGVVGVGLLLGVDLSGSGEELLGGLAVLLAGLGYAIGGLLAKHKLAERPPIGVAAWVLTAGAALLIPAAAIGAPETVPGIGPVAAVVALGVVGTGIAFAIFYELIATVGPARTFIVTYLAPAFAVVYGVTLLDEEISVTTIIGLALILFGSYLAAEGRNPLRGRRGRNIAAELAPAAQDGSGAVPVRVELAGEPVERP
jgi:drug/metabolite transporter (DMT)-like permease